MMREEWDRPNGYPYRAVADEARAVAVQTGIELRAAETELEALKLRCRALLEADRQARLSLANAIRQCHEWARVDA